MPATAAQETDSQEDWFSSLGGNAASPVKSPKTGVFEEAGSHERAVADQLPQTDRGKTIRVQRWNCQEEQFVQRQYGDSTGAASAVIGQWLFKPCEDQCPQQWVDFEQTTGSTVLGERHRCGKASSPAL